MNYQEARVLAEIGRLGSLEAFRSLLAENDALIARPSLDNGRRIVEERSAIFTGLVRHWAETMHRGTGGDKAFAVVAVGGTGRGEITPYSDTDFALLFEEQVKGNPLAENLLHDLVSAARGGFKDRYGFGFQPPTFSLDDAPALEGQTLNTMLDMRPVYDPNGLAGAFRERIRATYDPFEHFLHVRGFWKDRWEKAAFESERLEGFHIKNDALRVFLAGVWTLAGKRFVSSREIYGSEIDRRDLEAYDFLLRVRSWVHLRRRAGRGKPQAFGEDRDMMSFEDFIEFGDLLGDKADETARLEYADKARSRLLGARRRVARFARGVIQRELQDGRAVVSVPGVTFRVGGLARQDAGGASSARARSSAALTLLRASQRYGVPIDPTELQGTFHDAGDWLMRVPELSALFYEQRGSLADSLEFLSQIEGAEDRLFPGYRHFESSIDQRVRMQKTTLRGVFEREKLRALDDYVREGRAEAEGKLAHDAASDPGKQVMARVEAALLDQDQLAAVKLSLKMKRLPVTPEDLAPANGGKPTVDRLRSGFSGIPLDEYLARFESECDFTKDTLRIARLLITHRRLLMRLTEQGPNDKEQVDEVVRSCGDERVLRALFVFTCADRAHWESPRDRGDSWRAIRELYNKSMLNFHPGLEPEESLRAAGFDPEQQAILRDFGPDFYTSNYRQYAVRFGGHLAELAEKPDDTKPKAAILREGDVTIIAVAARDYPGLAASITGALWHREVPLLRAHLFSAAKYGLALDFFQVSPRAKGVTPELIRFIEKVIEEKGFIGDADEAGLPPTQGRATLGEWRPGKCCLQFQSEEDGLGLVYALAYKVHKYLESDIFALTAHTTADQRAFVSVYHELPAHWSLSEAKKIVEERF